MTMYKIAANLTLPADAVTQVIAILGRRGSGKTNTAVVLAEKMLAANQPIVVLDPLGVWWGLKSKFSIAVLGGDHADMPLEADSGSVVADFVVSHRLPVILDVSAFGENEMRRFVGDFARAFYKANRDPIHWFVDEADEFAPQNASGGPLAKCLGSMQNIVRRGRARGIGVTLITQRSAVLNKSLLTQAECLIAHQTTGPHDRKAIEEWFKYHGDAEWRAEILKALSKLKVGQAWIYSPSWLDTLSQVQIFARKSFDSSRTPKPGEQKKTPTKLEDIDLMALSKQMVETIRRAEADDPRLLKKRISELGKRIRELDQQIAQQVPVADRAAIEREVYGAIQQRDEWWTGRWDKMCRTVNERMAEVVQSAQNTLAPVETPKPPVGKTDPAVNKNAPSRIITNKTSQNSHNSRIPVNNLPVDVSDLDELSKAERLILRACYWLQGETATKAKVGFYSGYSFGSGGFNNALGKLRSAGLIVGLTITEAGSRLMAGNVDAKPTGDELRDWLRPKLNKAENRVLDVLCDGYPAMLSNEEMAIGSGYSVGSGGFNNALGRLRSLEAAIGYLKDGGTKAADVFFD